MNEAHYHLVINHFPIVGTIFGLGILLAGLVLKRSYLKNTAYVLFCIAAITGILSMNTGEGAEEMVENLSGVGHKIIHEHEEIAEKLALVLNVLGLLSLVGLYLETKKNRFANLISYLALALAILAVFIGKEVGTSGGEIRHTEIRSTTTVSSSTPGVESQEADEE
jgi:uncharacterized membrane protein